VTAVTGLADPHRAAVPATPEVDLDLSSSAICLGVNFPLQDADD
jgi:hypothetical protein